MKKLFSVIMVLALAATASAATVRFEAEVNPENTDNKTSCSVNNSILGTVIFSETGNLTGAGTYVNYFNTSLSGGEAVYSALANADCKIVFVGTGVDLICETRASGGADFIVQIDGDWSSSTTLTTKTGVDAFQAAIPLCSGLTNTIHTLKLMKRTAEVLRIDAFDVHDSGTRIRYEEDDPAVKNYSSTGTLGRQWSASQNGAGLDEKYSASGGSYIYTTTLGAYTTVDFTGGGIVFGTLARDVSNDATWYIDHQRRSGVFNIQKENSYWWVAKVAWGLHYRWPMLVANDLAPGAHQLVLVNGPDRYHKVLHNVDFFDVIGETTPVELSDMSAQ